MFTQSSSLGLQIAFRFGVAPPLSSELFPTPARSSLSSSAVTSVSSFCLPTPGSRGLGAAGTPHRTDQDHGRVGWNPAPQALQQGLCRLWETPSSSPSQCWEVNPPPRSLGRSGTQRLGCAIRALPACSRTMSGCQAPLLQLQPAPRAADGALGS